jgi:hypothetical protein
MLIGNEEVKQTRYICAPKNLTNKISWGRGMKSQLNEVWLLENIIWRFLVTKKSRHSLQLKK